jgi:hypothetical protein
MSIRCKATTTLSVVLVHLLLLTIVAHSQPVRYVSASGLNSNDCTLAAPCRTMQRGINRTPAGGVLQVMNSGHYGPMSIERPITIQSVAGSASVAATVINAPGAVVVLSGLLVNGTNTAADTRGILINDAAAVHIVRCEVERFPGSQATGIEVNATNIQLFISDTIVRANGKHGLRLDAGNAQVAIDNSRFEDNGFDGIRDVGTADMTISRVISSRNTNAGIANQNGIANITATTVANNGTNGFLAIGSGQMNIDHSVATKNFASGLLVSSGSTARISNSVFTNNGTGLNNSGSTLLSRGDNTVQGNGTATSGAITPFGAM